MTNWSAILVGDLHLRVSQPPCRKRDFIRTQVEKMEFIKDLQYEHMVPVIFAGDIFDHWKPSPRLLSLAFDMLPEDAWSVAGNHDLPSHSYSRIQESGIQALYNSGRLQYRTYLNNPDFADFTMRMAHYGYDASDEPCDLLVLHEYVYKEKTKHWESDDASSTKLMRMYPNARTIFTGDNHCPFVNKSKKQLHINGGSITVQKADEDHHPCVWLWNADGEYERIDIPTFNSSDVSREHLNKVEIREEKMTVLVDRLTDEDHEFTLDYRENMEIFLEQENIPAQTEEEIWKAITGDDNA